MDEIDSHLAQQTPPPSPYLETTWDLPLEQVHHGLLHPKEKRRGYLELYFAGFMEFVDEPPSPAMSDDETEYPRWGRITSTRDEPPPSAATAKVSQSCDTMPFSDTTEPEIPLLSRRTATASTDSTGSDGYESSLTDLPPSALPGKRLLTRYQRRKRVKRRSNSTRESRITKTYRRECSTVRTRSMAINSQQRLRSHASLSSRNHSCSKG